MKRQALTFSVVALAVVICVVSSTLAQNARKANGAGVVTVVSGGILNGKATSLPTPAYPAAAAAIGATGPVTVQVLIDELGKVTAPKAVAGHELLRAAAVEAASKATFSPTKLEGKLVKVSGVIVYNFAPPLSVTRLIFVLSHADLTGRFGAFASGDSLAVQLPADWTQEKELLNSLTFAEASQNLSSDGSGKSGATGDLSAGGKLTQPKSASVKGDLHLPSYTARDLDERSRGSVRELLDAVKARGSNDDRSEWEFELGKALAELVTVLEDQSDLGPTIEKLREVRDSAPAEVAPRSREQLSQFVEGFNDVKITDENRAEMVKSAVRLTNLRY